MKVYYDRDADLGVLKGKKIAVIGFSAGGHLVAAISNHFEQRLYPAVDAADKESCRPDFAVAVYPGHLSLHAAEWDAKQGTKKFVIPHLEHQSITNVYLALNPDLHVRCLGDGHPS